MTTTTINRRRFNFDGVTNEALELLAKIMKGGKVGIRAYEIDVRYRIHNKDFSRSNDGLVEELDANGFRIRRMDKGQFFNWVWIDNTREARDEVREEMGRRQQ